MTARPPAPEAPKKKATRKRRPRKGAAGRTQRHDERERKPGLGLKWSCFSCGAKFYDLNKPEPVCPKCGTDQSERPSDAPGEAPTPQPRRPSVAPMTRLLEEEEPAAEFESDDDDEASELDIESLEENGYLAVDDEDD